VGPLFPALKRRAIFERPSGAELVPLITLLILPGARRLNRLRKKANVDARPLKGRVILKEFMVSLKRYPDTEPEFFRSL
jgi:hypothetical protein